MKKLLLSLLGLTAFVANAQLATEGFESNWPAAGWTTLNISGPEQTWQQSPAGSTQYPAYVGNHAALLLPENVANNTQSEDWLITPQFIVPANGQISFYSRMLQDGDQGGTYKLLIGTNPAEPNTFITLQQWTEMQLNAVQTEYAPITVVLPEAYAGAQRYIAFVAQGDNGDGWLIDEVTIQEECTAPTNLTIANVTPNSFTTAWTGGMSTMWEVVVLPSGEVPNGPGEPTVSNPYEVVGVSVDTCYDVYVRSICSSTTVSEWTGPLSVCISENFSTISGSAHFDVNADGVCNTDDIVLPNAEIQVAVDGVSAVSVYTNAQGEYRYYMQEPGTYEISFTPVAPLGFTAPNPITQTVTVTNIITQFIGPDFCYEAPSAPVTNLSVSVIPLSQTRPGFDTTLSVLVQNTGSTVVTGASASFAFDVTRFQLVAIDGTPVTGTSPLTLSIDALNPFASQSYNITLLAQEPPVNNGGDEVSFTATLSYNDDTANDNSYTLEQVIVNSFDPNDITVHQGGEITPAQVADYLTYTIRFENTGTASAVNVRLEQELDEKLDWSTFTPVGSSHNYAVQRSGNDVVVKYNDINLPFTTDVDPLSSHGYFTYRIKPETTVVVGDIMYGTAGIHFDFNAPVITNTCSTQVVVTAGTDAFTFANVKLYPNPATDRLNIGITNGTLQSVAVYDLNGRLCLQSASETTINTSVLNSGLYLVKVVTDKGSGNYKLIKK